MQFLNPVFLYAGLLALVPLLLYFFRRKSKTVRVSSLLFFKTLAREHQESAWLRRLKKLLSLLITLLIMAGAVLALAGLTASPRPDDFRHLVIAVDRSASMSATRDGATLLQQAVDDLDTRLAAVPASVPVAVIAFDARPEVLLAATTNRRDVQRTLERLQARPVAADPDAALASARRLAALDHPAQIWFATDQPPPPPADLSDPSDLSDLSDATETPADLRWFQHALAEPVNAGITAFQIRPSPLQRGRFQAFVQVRLNAAAAGAREVTLELRLAGYPIQLRRLTLDPGQTESLVLDLEGVEGQLLEAEVSCDDDALAADNWAGTLLPELRPLVVAWYHEPGQGDPFTGFALQAIAAADRVQVFTGGPGAWPPREGADVLVLDGWLPDQWHADTPAVVINPPARLAPLPVTPLPGRLPRDQIRVTNPGHPVLFRVPGTRVSLTQTSAIDATGSLEPLWMADNDAVLAAGEIQGQRLVLLGFSPQRSEFLPLSAAYPLLLGNAVLWAAAAGEESAATIAATGELVALAAGPDMDTHAIDAADAATNGALAIDWQQWDGRSLVSQSITLTGPLLEIDRVGLWRSDHGRRGAGILAAPGETDLPALDPEAAATTALVADTPGAWSGRLRGDLAPWLIGLALLLLLLESWLFHRHAVH